jgi:3-oxoacyl-[acyl-carrier protein] reductase
MLVTGASRGIGLACARLLAQRGATVVMAARQAEALGSAAAQIDTDLGRSATVAVPCDAADPVAVRDLFQRVLRECQRLDGLVANAGVMQDALIGMVNAELIDRVFHTNTASLLYAAQYASRLMARHGGGSIVALSSIVGVQGHAGQSVYAGSKAAVIGIVQSLAQELAPSAIRVNALAPGFIDTDLTRALPEDKRSATLARVALGRAGTPEDVAEVAAFLCSDASRYVTGQVIGVDGGLRL